MRPARQQVLAERKQRLLIRGAELRVRLAHDARVLQGPLAVADQAVAGLQWLRAHPLVPLGAIAALALLRPRRALGWATRLWWGWGLARRARAWLATPTAAGRPSKPQ